ncbi:hypothetical protein KIPB_014834, partial [Kipferlia bialata]
DTNMHLLYAAALSGGVSLHPKAALPEEAPLPPRAEHQKELQKQKDALMVNLSSYQTQFQLAFMQHEYKRAYEIMTEYILPTLNLSLSLSL